MIFGSGLTGCCVYPTSRFLMKNMSYVADVSHNDSDAVFLTASQVKPKTISFYNTRQQAAGSSA